MLQPTYERTFLRSYKKTKKRGYDMAKIEHVINALIENQVLPQKYRNHKLKGEYNGCWECHIEPDWLLIYKNSNNYCFYRYRYAFRSFLDF